jgi:gamma-glutamyltranspeptidase/glutathione hydrolase
MVYHAISNVIDHRMPLAEAVAAPRMHHQGLPDTLQVEPGGFPAATLDSLAARGHAIMVADEYWGDVQAIIRTPAGWQGVSDSRGGGGGEGY